MRTLAEREGLVFVEGIKPKGLAMPKFAANLTMLFNEAGFLDRFAAAKRAGLAGVEYLFPYDHDGQRIRARLDEHGLTQVLHNLPAGNWAGGRARHRLSSRSRGEFGDGVGAAIEYATALGCTQLNCLAGIVPPGVDADEAARHVRRATCAFAAPTAAGRPASGC